VTGVGFIGAGLLFRQADDKTATVHGVTTAASILAAAAIGAVAGEGFYLLALIATTLVILALEFRYIPGVRMLDARRWSHHFKDDTDPHHGAPPKGFLVVDAAGMPETGDEPPEPPHPHQRPHTESVFNGAFRPTSTPTGTPVSPMKVAQVAAVQSAIMTDADESVELGTHAGTPG